MQAFEGNNSLGPIPDWLTPTERWIVQQLSKSTGADLTELPHDVRSQYADADQAPFDLAKILEASDVGAFEPPSWQVVTGDFISKFMDGEVNPEKARDFLLMGAYITGVVAIDEHTEFKSFLISGSVFEEELNLEGCSFGSVGFTNTWFLGECSISGGTILGDLVVSDRVQFLKGFSFAEARIEQSAVFMGATFHRSDQIDAGAFFPNAKISGSLAFSECTFHASVFGGNSFVAHDVNFNKANFRVGNKLIALNMYSAEVGGVLMLAEASFEGQINLGRAHIGGDVNANRVTTEVGIGIYSIDLNSCVIDGGLWIMQGAKINGEINLKSAKIGIGVDFSGASFNSNGAEYAINANRADIGGYFFIRKGAEVHGGVNLNGASIRIGLDCSDSKFFAAADSTSIEAGRVKIRGYVLARRSTFIGAVRFSNAQIGGALGFENSSVDARSTGALQMDGGEFSQGVWLSGAKVTSYGTNSAVNISGAVVSRGINLGDNAEFRGTVNMNSVRVDGNIIGSSSHFHSLESATAIFGDSIHVSGSIMLRRGTKVDGNVDFSRAIINRDFQIFDSEFNGILRMGNAKIGGEFRGDESKANLAPPRWGKNSEVELINTEIDTLQSSLNSWRRGKAFIKLSLSGLKVKRFSGGIGGDSIDAEFPEDIVAWIEQGTILRENKSRGFPQSPYTNIAETLDIEGRPDTARYVRIALEKRKTKVLAVGPRKLFRLLLSMVNAYGYRPYRGFIWIGALTISFAVLGILMTDGFGGLSPNNYVEAWSWLGFSFEQAIPFVDLDPINDNFLQTQFGIETNAYGYAAPEDLPFGVRALFMAERVLGVIILGMSLAGITAWAERRG